MPTRFPRSLILAPLLVLAACSSPPAGDGGAKSESDEAPLLAGKRFSESEVAEALRAAGLPESQIGRMVCTAKYESSFYEGAQHRNANGSTDYGLFQINDHYWAKNCGTTASGLLHATTNAACAKQVFDAQGNNAWAAYKSHRSECASYRAPAPLGNPTTNPGGGDTGDTGDDAGAPDPNPNPEPNPNPDPGGDDAGTGPDPNPPATSESPCYSSTLSSYVDSGVCVQGAATGNWFQCSDGTWLDGGDNGTGPAGPCTDSYPL